jgi:hypothetical protein
MLAKNPADELIPYPEEFRKQDAKRKEAQYKADKGEIPQTEVYNIKDGFNSGGYEWCNQHWGTKWGIFEVGQKAKSQSTYRSFSFKTAWSPPTPVILALAAKFPQTVIEFQYFEMGAAFQGKLIIKGTSILQQEQKEYKGKRGG